MKQMNLNDTIAAIATPPGVGGIGIVRISGPAALPVLQAIFCPGHRQEPGASTARFSPESHRLYYGHIVDPSALQVVDEVMAVYMAAPKSYTAEDVVEIQCHAGSYVLQRVLALVIDQNVRPADPGEFTRRAFLNGRLDLTRAEATIDMIHARTEAAHNLAVNQLSGMLMDDVSGVKQVLVHALAGIEAGIDFADDLDDDDDVFFDVDTVREKGLGVLDRLIANHDKAHIIRDGIRLVIAGPPNVGKSSLLNALLSKDRAIVAPISGTTRDVIEESIHLDGLPLLISDTAGIHDSTDTIEKIGIDRTWQAVSHADMVLVVADVSRTETFISAAELVSNIDTSVVLLVNKVDIGRFSPSMLPEALSSVPVLSVSTKTGEGIDELKTSLSDMLLPSWDTASHGAVPNLRHVQLLKKARKSMDRALVSAASQMGPELIAVDLSQAIMVMNEILGIHIATDVLDTVFSSFCIGK